MKTARKVDLVAPLANRTGNPATDMRATDTAGLDTQAASGAASPLSDRQGGVDSAKLSSTSPTQIMPGIRTSTMATRIGTTRTTSSALVPSADEPQPSGHADFSKVHFSSKTDLWYTPQDFFDKLNAQYGFELDVCATHENAKCTRYFTKEQDGLKQEWNGICWMNPPYGRGITAWMRKAFESSQGGATVVCLVPARTDTAWWHEYSMKGEITFVRGRLKFGGAKHNAPFPCAVVVFKP